MYLQMMAYPFNEEWLDWWEKQRQEEIETYRDIINSAR